MKKWLMALLALAMFLLVGQRIYREGKMLSNSKTPAEAFREMKKAAELGDKHAQYRLARCYDRGHMVERNDSLAFQWYMKAAQQGSGKAMYQVGKCYRNGAGVTINPEFAFTWFSRAAMKDNANAQYALGRCYMKGEGVVADQDKAGRWLRRAIQNPKGGADIQYRIKKHAAEGNEDARNMIQLINSSSQL